MIKYNFRKVLRESRYSGHELINIIKFITFKFKYYTSMTRKDEMYSKINWDGPNFLVNPKELFKHRALHSDAHIVEYIGLSSLRNYSQYVVTGDTTLDLLACSKKEDLINNNSLLQIKDGRVHFLYEEAQNKE